MSEKGTDRGRKREMDGDEMKKGIDEGIRKGSTYISGSFRMPKEN